MGRAEDLFERLESGGLAAVAALFDDRLNEDLHLEFKRSADHGRGAKLADPDRDNLARAVSGFANTDGGVVVWGVGTSRDQDFASQACAIEDCRRFAGLIDTVVSGVTVPPVAGVRSIPIPTSDGTAGFVATLVPSSSGGPHQHAQTKTYLVRLGSKFEPAHHMLLAGMFGRKPQPLIFPMFAIESASLTVGSDGQGAHVHLRVIVTNESGVLARDAYVAWRVEQLPSAASRLKVGEIRSGVKGGWTLDAPLPRMGACLAMEGNRIAPFSQQVPLQLAFTLAPPFTDDLRWRVTCGASGAAPHHMTFSCGRNVLTEIYSSLTQPAGYGAESIPLGKATRILGMDETAVSG